MSKIRDETLRGRQAELKHNQELIQLRKEQRIKDSQIRSLEADKRQKEVILRRKQEEVSTDRQNAFICHHILQSCADLLLLVCRAFVRRNHHAVAVMFVHLSGTGVHFHMGHFRRIKFMVSPMFWTPKHFHVCPAIFFQFHL